jgi:hypothetical protein
VSAFDYLAVLISIVLGLGIAQILTGIADLVRARDRVTPFAPTFFQMGNMFLIHLQMWWSMFGLRHLQDWTFPMFLFTLMQPVLLYLMTAFLVPQVPAEGPLDMETAYFRERAWFSAALFASVVVSLTRSTLTDGHLPEPANLAAHGLFAVLGIAGVVARSRRVHLFLAPAFSVVLVLYVAVLFANLR